MNTDRRSRGCLQLIALVLALASYAGAGEPDGAGAILYNGIRLPSPWPPRNGEAANGQPPPYLRHPPPVIRIDVGRQLFVDDFLIDRTDLVRRFHEPEKYSGNPILKPETPPEEVGGSIAGPGDRTLDSDASPFDDGVFYDAKDGWFKLWYQAGMLHDTALAYSRDGLHWQRPRFDVVPGTNIVIPYDPAYVRDAFAPWLDDHAADPRERFKAYRYERSTRTYEGGYLYTSPDGIHWTQRARLRDIGSNDDTLMYYNPFRDRWCLSLRAMSRRNPEHQPRRIRDYFESRDFMGLTGLDRGNHVFWAAADELDPPDPTWRVQDPTQLYALAAAPYESLLLGLITIHYGPSNEVCEAGRFPKLTQIKVAFSRDGFYWDRSNRNIFIGATKREGDWDRGYVRAAGGGCLVVGDKLYFYYCGFSGYNNDHRPSMYAGGSTHVAMLRRDGFASMDAPSGGGLLVTRPVIFRGRHLFVNADAPQGRLQIEVLDESGRVIPPFGFDRCIPIEGDATKLRVRWRGKADLGELAGRVVRFRFRVERGSLYSFWVSPSERGESNGYVAAGGPGFDGDRDVPPSGAGG